MHDSSGVKFHKAEDQEIIDSITVNTFPMTFMTRFLGVNMKERNKKSAIINMTSFYSDWPVYN